MTFPCEHGDYILGSTKRENDEILKIPVQEIRVQHKGHSIYKHGGVIRR